MSLTACHEIEPLLERHLAGTASPQDTAALATHARGCSRCAAALRPAADTGFSGGRGEPPIPASSVGRPPGWRSRHPAMVGLVAVGVLALSGAALWHTASRPQVPRTFIRGRGGDLPLLGAWQPDGTLRLTWPHTGRAAAFHVHLTGSTGLEVTRSVTQPAVVIKGSEIAALGDIAVVVDAETEGADPASRSTSLVFPKRATP
jgi:hypothetical protein